MADYMHACPSCHTFYPPGVAQTVRNGVCTCGTSLQITNIPASEFVNMTREEAVRRLSSELDLSHPPKSTPGVQHRKKPVPEVYNVNPDRFGSVGCLFFFAWIGVFGGSVVLFFLDGFRLIYLFAGVGLALFLYVFARLADDVSNAVRHLGAIRWLMEHGDETESVPTAQPIPSKKRVDSGFWGVAAVLLLVAAIVVFYALRNG